MSSEDPCIEIKCENMMNTVVESRKRFRKMCINYEQKISLVENKILNFQIEKFSNYKIKPKHPIPAFDSEGLEDLDKFAAEISKRKQRNDDLRKKIKDTHEIVTQLKSDDLGRRLRVPLTLENLLAKTEGKNA